MSTLTAALEEVCTYTHKLRTIDAAREWAVYKETWQRSGGDSGKWRLSEPRPAYRAFSQNFRQLHLNQAYSLFSVLASYSIATCPAGSTPLVI